MIAPRDSPCRVWMGTVRMDVRIRRIVVWITSAKVFPRVAIVDCQEQPRRAIPAPRLGIAPVLRPVPIKITAGTVRTLVVSVMQSAILARIA